MAIVHRMSRNLDSVLQPSLHKNNSYRAVLFSERFYCRSISTVVKYCNSVSGNTVQPLSWNQLVTFHSFWEVIPKSAPKISRNIRKTISNFMFFFAVSCYCMQGDLYESLVAQASRPCDTGIKAS